MNQPLMQHVHFDKPLTNMSVNYMQKRSGFLHDLFATLGVNEKSGIYFKRDRASMLQAAAKKRTPGTTAAESGHEEGAGRFNCEEWAYRTKLPIQIARNYDTPLNADRAKVGHVDQVMLISREVDFVNTYFRPNIWGTTLNGVAVAPGPGEFRRFDDAASTPIAVFRAVIRAVQKASGGFKPNFAAMAPEVFDALCDHDDFNEKIKYSERGIVTAELIAQALGLEEILVGDGVYNIAKEGQPEQIEFIIPKACLIGYKTKTPALDEPSAGYIFSHSEFDKATKESGAPAIRRYWQDDIKSWWYEGEAYYDMGLVDAACGYYLHEAVS